MKMLREELGWSRGYLNLSNNADTTGAIYGQIAGAYYGDKTIPLSWRKKITEINLIITLSRTLAQ
jgi:ADP-ribosyl-[dinitrogen reductase] hydrolase